MVNRALYYKGVVEIRIEQGDDSIDYFDDELFYYDGDDLGSTYHPDNTDFRLWAPTASKAMLVTYETWDNEVGKEIPMKKAEKGTWTLSLAGDQHGLHYTYRVKIDGGWNEAVDPYTRSVAINGNHGVVIDLSKSNPSRWDPNTKPKLENTMDSIIYELHVRDLSIHPESGIKNKGLFLGLTERGTTGPQGTKTGLDHILDLGVTHVQLLPIFDYNSLNERITAPQFNWGYDPQNYNAPEGTYATDPYDPLSRIIELKQVVQSLHDSGVRVIMDVVYNHMFDAHSSNLHKLVPGYFYRYNEDGTLANGTGVGNDTASERKMMRKFIVDSVTYWTKEYNLDGYRFDLMGIHDTQTMNEVRKALDEIDPSIIVIGEGWDMDTCLPADQKANQTNVHLMPRIAHFNDTLRDGVRGSIWDHAGVGFVNGLQGAEHIVKTGIVGGIAYNSQIRTWGDVDPDQVVSYVEAHDNHTLWDKLFLTNGNDSEEIRMHMHKLASSISLTSQGISFIHAGQEFIRTKYGHENSYNSSDAYNRLEWDRKAEHEDIVEYFKGMIHLRKSHPAFRMTTSDMIRKHLHFLDAPDNMVAYTITGNANGDEWGEIVVAYNANREPQQMTLSASSGEWYVVLNGEQAGIVTIQVIKGNVITVPALSAMVLHSTTESE